jgi:hypothetical protein
VGEQNDAIISGQGFLLRIRIALYPLNKEQQRSSQRVSSTTLMTFPWRLPIQRSDEQDMPAELPRHDRIAPTCSSFISHSPFSHPTSSHKSQPAF